MKIMIGFRAVVGVLVLSSFNQVQPASRRITSPSACREQAEQLLHETKVFEKRQFKTDKTRHAFEMKLFRKFNQILAGMAILGQGTDWRERMQALQTECDDAALEELDVAQLVAITQKIAVAMIEFEKEVTPPPTEVADLESVVSVADGDFRARLRSRVRRSIDEGNNKGVSQLSGDEARAKLATVLLGLAEFMDITQDSSVSKARFIKLQTLTQEALALIDMINEDMPLSDPRQKELTQLHKELSAKIGSQRGISPQVSAKVAVFIVQGLLQVAGALAIQVNRLALAERPELVAQRSSYRKWGICTIVTAMALSAVLVAGNAAGWIDIQIVPTMADILSAFPNILSAS